MSEQLQSLMHRLNSAQGASSPLVRWGLLLIALIVLWSVLLMPYVEWREQKIEMLQMHISKVERLRALNAAADQWQKAELVFADEAKALTPLFFQASSYAVAQTDMLKLAHKYINQFQLKIDSQRLLDPEPEAGIGEIVGIKLHLQGKLVDILAFVNALSKDSRLLIADSLYIARQREDTALLQLGLQGYRQTVAAVKAEL